METNLPAWDQNRAPADSPVAPESCDAGPGLEAILESFEQGEPPFHQDFLISRWAAPGRFSLDFEVDPLPEFFS